MVRERRRYATYGTVLVYFHVYGQSATKEEMKVSDRRTWDLSISDLSVSPLIDYDSVEDTELPLTCMDAWLLARHIRDTRLIEVRTCRVSGLENSISTATASTSED
jgi:hypothetical protein